MTWAYYTLYGIYVRIGRTCCFMRLIQNINEPCLKKHIDPHIQNVVKKNVKNKTKNTYLLQWYLVEVKEKDPEERDTPSRGSRTSDAPPEWGQPNISPGKSWRLATGNTDKQTRPITCWQCILTQSGQQSLSHAWFDTETVRSRQTVKTLSSPLKNMFFTIVFLQCATNKIGLPHKLKGWKLVNDISWVELRTSRLTCFHLISIIMPRAFNHLTIHSI